MADDISDFRLFHAYYDLVVQGKAKPIRCPFCQYEFVVSHHNGDLRLVCYTCDSSVIPGVDTVSNVRAVVREHIL